MKQLFTITVLILSLSSIQISAQSSIDEKLQKIGSKVNKIVIQTDNETLSFDGEEAEQLFNRINSPESKIAFWIDGGDDTLALTNKKKIIIKEDDDSKEFELADNSEPEILILKQKSGNEDGDALVRKNVQVEINNGNKKITITTNEDGKEKTEVLEGDEAEEYLENHKSGDDEMIFPDKNCCKKHKVIIIEQESEKEED